MEPDSFVLSRIYAQGWNTAKKLLIDKNLAATENVEASLNPYRTAQKAARWIKGFDESLASQVGKSRSGGKNLWRRAEPASPRQSKEAI